MYTAKFYSLEAGSV